MKKEMPPKNDIFETLELKWGCCKSYDDILAKVDYIEQTDAGLKVHCHKVEKEKKMNKNEELKNVDTIIITRKGNTVSVDAYDEYSNGCRTTCHRAIAECSPDDIFDFNIGAKLAFDRLYEGYDMTPKPKRKPYNGLIYINKYPGAALKDKSIYRVKDGVIQKCMFGAGPFIYEGMSDAELSMVIDDVVYGRHTINFGFTHEEEDKHPLTVAHFVIYDKT